MEKYLLLFLIRIYPSNPPYLRSISVLFTFYFCIIHILFSLLVKLSL